MLTSDTWYIRGACMDWPYTVQVYPRSLHAATNIEVDQFSGPD